MKVHCSTFALGMLAGLFSVSALAVPAGKVLFTQPGTEIVNEKGEKRPAKRGDQLESGDRLLTPVGAITQVLLPDGSLVGMRPGSELKLDATGPEGDRPGQVISLVQGSLRVIGSELMDVKKLSALTVQTGMATLRLSGADLESAVVKPTDVKIAGALDAGSYSRLLVGTGSIGSGTLVEPLTTRQVSFVGVANLAPITVATVSPNLFTSAPVLTAANLNSLTAPVAGGTVTGKTPVVTAPLATTSTLTAPVLGGTKLVTTAPVVTSPVVTTAILNTPVVVASAPPQTLVIQPIVTNLAPIITRTPVTTTLIKTCTNVVIGGKKVCV